MERPKILKELLLKDIVLGLFSLFIECTQPCDADSALNILWHHAFCMVQQLMNGSGVRRPALKENHDVCNVVIFTR